MNYKIIIEEIDEEIARWTIGEQHFTDGFVRGLEVARKIIFFHKENQNDKTVSNK